MERTPGRRDKLEIIHDILKVMQDKREGKIKPTHLMYKSNLSHQRMKEYVEELKDKEMIKEVNEEGKQYFIITDKGHDFLANFKKLREFTDVYGLSRTTY